MLCMMLVGFKSYADVEVNKSILDVVQYVNKNDEVKFDMKLYELSLGYVFDNNFGIRYSYGRSVEESVDGRYSNFITRMHTGQVFYRLNLSPVKVDFGVGKTETDSEWLVDGVSPSWSKSKDSDWSYHVNLHYQYGDSSSVTVGYSDFYRKDKVDNHQYTRGWRVGYTYKF